GGGSACLTTTCVPPRNSSTANSSRVTIGRRPTVSSQRAAAPTSTTLSRTWPTATGGLKSVGEDIAVSFVKSQVIASFETSQHTVNRADWHHRAPPMSRSLERGGAANYGLSSPHQ